MNIRSILLSLLCITATTAYAAEETTIDRTVEVAYQCKIDEQTRLPLTAMYGIKGNNVVVAQVKLNGVISPGMWRINNILMNTFVSTDPQSLPTMWTTLPANADNLTEVNGGKLSYAEKEGMAHTIIVEDCQLDKAATQKLNQH